VSAFEFHLESGCVTTANKEQQAQDLEGNKKQDEEQELKQQRVQLSVARK